MKRYILTVGDSFDPDKGDLSEFEIISAEELTTCGDCGMEPLPTVEGITGLFVDKRMDIIFRLRGNTIFRCKRGSEVIRRYYSRYRVEGINLLTDSIVQMDIDYPIGEEGKE